MVETSRTPLRVLQTCTLVNTLGNGLFITVGVLFLTRKVHLPAGEVGLGLSIAAGCGLVAGVQLGRVADRRGYREVLLLLTAVQGLACAAYAVVGAFWAFLLVAVVETVCDRGASSARNALVATAFPAAERVRARARLRVMTNVGISLGALGGGLVLHVDTKAAYQVALLVDAASFLVTAVLYLLLPRVPGREPAPGEPRLPALRDRPFVAITVLNAVLSLQFGLIETGVPLWIANRTHAPRSTVAIALLVNTVLCVPFTVRATRGTDDLAHAARVQTRAGLLLAAACVLFALAYHRGAVVAVVLLLVAAVVETAGELFTSAGGWGLSYGLAPAHQQGIYQGVFNAGFGLAATVGPAVVTALCITWGVPGWCVLGGIFAAAGLAVPPVARWAVRTRPAADARPAPA